MHKNFIQFFPLSSQFCYCSTPQTAEMFLQCRPQQRFQCRLRLCCLRLRSFCFSPALASRGVLSAAHFVQSESEEQSGFPDGGGTIGSPKETRDKRSKDPIMKFIVRLTYSQRA